MIVLKNNGQVAEFYDRYGLTRPTNLCQLINKTFWFSTLLVFVGFIGVTFLVGTVAVLFGMWPYWVAHIAVLEWTVILFAAALWGWHKWKETHPGTGLQPQWQQNLGEAWDGFIKRFCPLVEFK